MSNSIRKVLLGIAVLAALALGAGAIAQAGDSGPAQNASPQSDVAEGPEGDGDGEVPDALEAADEGPDDGSDKNDTDATSGPGADKAAAAALEITGGKANSVEQDGENGATWEVEVTKPNGQTVDVRLDENYKLVVIENDHGE